MRKIELDILDVVSRNRDGSFQTQRDRLKILRMSIREVRQLGYNNLERIQDFKGRHVNALLSHWKNNSLTPGTIKNRMSAIRWLTRKIGKAGIVPKSNKVCGIPNRSYIQKSSKAIPLSQSALVKISDPYVALSVQLQQAFGLRREEAMKFSINYSDKGNYIQLKASWCKGGKSRTIPVRNSLQRELLQTIYNFRGKGSLIPPDKSYIEQVKIFERQTSNAGIGNTHGLRHQYAQTRYLELTGRNAPLAGGKSSDELTKEERITDRTARLTISRELGHEREQITTAYLGR